MLASAVAGILGANALHPPHVDTNRRQSASRTHPDGQSLVERTALCQPSRTYDFLHAVSRSRHRNRIRFYFSSVAPTQERRKLGLDRARTEKRRRFLRRILRDAPLEWNRPKNLED